jgi:hypothetical protein
MLLHFLFANLIVVNANSDAPMHGEKLEMPQKEERIMKLITSTGLALLLAVGYGIAAERGKPLDKTACQAVWVEATEGNNDLTEDKADKYVVQFTLVDTNGDGRISDVEWKNACTAGLILAAAHSMDMEKSGAN